MYWLRQYDIEKQFILWKVYKALCLMNLYFLPCTDILWIPNIYVQKWALSKANPLKKQKTGLKLILKLRHKAQFFFTWDYVEICIFKSNLTEE